MYERMLEEVTELIVNALEEGLAEDITAKAREGSWRRREGKHGSYYKGERVVGYLNIESDIPVQLSFDKENREAVIEAYNVLFELGALMEDI